MLFAEGDLSIDRLGRSRTKSADHKRKIRGGQICIVLVHIGVGGRIDPKSDGESILHESLRLCGCVFT